MIFFREKGRVRKEMKAEGTNNSYTYTNRTFSPDVTLVYETKDFSLTSLTFFCSVHHDGRCAFVF